MWQRRGEPADYVVQTFDVSALLSRRSDGYSTFRLVLTSSASGSRPCRLQKCVDGGGQEPEDCIVLWKRRFGQICSDNDISAGPGYGCHGCLSKN